MKCISILYDNTISMLQLHWHLHYKHWAFVTQSPTHILVIGSFMSFWDNKLSLYRGFSSLTGKNVTHVFTWEVTCPFEPLPGIPCLQKSTFLSRKFGSRTINFYCLPFLLNCALTVQPKSVEPNFPSHSPDHCESLLRIKTNRFV